MAPPSSPPKAGFSSKMQGRPNLTDHNTPVKVSSSSMISPKPPTAPKVNRGSGHKPALTLDISSKPPPLKLSGV